MDQSTQISTGRRLDSYKTEDYPKFVSKIALKFEFTIEFSHVPLIFIFLGIYKNEGSGCNRFETVHVIIPWDLRCKIHLVISGAVGRFLSKPWSVAQCFTLAILLLVQKYIIMLHLMMTCIKFRIYTSSATINNKIYADQEVKYYFKIIYNNLFVK